jgi:hypothetical protein
MKINVVTVEKHKTAEMTSLIRFKAHHLLLCIKTRLNGLFWQLRLNMRRWLRPG